MKWWKQSDRIFLFPSRASIYKLFFECNSVGACWKQLKTKKSHLLPSSSRRKKERKSCGLEKEDGKQGQAHSSQDKSKQNNNWGV